ncbi:hypothetical protein CL619_02140 [archaeon]|nr:hypothetical protein [archaeon]|tara:strand:- start:1648 stop:2007 length:360 start_codon:yes stop_codon:yes gene_type:complete
MITATSLAIFLALISTILGSIGSLMFKLSANTLTTLKEVLKKNFLIRFITGAIVFVISVIIYTFALNLVELSFLFPFVALSYIWTNFLSMAVLKEEISKKSWGGIVLICIGVIIMSLSG